MPGSRWWSTVPGKYVVAISTVAAAMLLRLALDPVLPANRFRYTLQLIAVLVCARYLGFGPAAAGMVLATVPALYGAIGRGTADSRFWLALTFFWAFALFLIWLLDRVRRMRSQVESSTRLADERLQEAGKEKTLREREERYAAQLRAIVESSEDAIVSKSLDGIIQSWNHG